MVSSSNKIELWRQTIFVSISYQTSYSWRLNIPVEYLNRPIEGTHIHCIDVSPEEKYYNNVRPALFINEIAAVETHSQISMTKYRLTSMTMSMLEAVRSKSVFDAGTGYTGTSLHLHLNHRHILILHIMIYDSWFSEDVLKQEAFLRKCCSGGTYLI